MKSIQKLWKKLTRPHTSAEDVARHEYMTNTILVIMSLIFIISSIIFIPLWVKNLIPWDMPAAAILSTLIFSIGIWLSHRGFRFTSSLIPSLFFYLISIHSTYVYGLSETTILQYSLVIIFSFLMQKKWIQWAVYFICIVTVFLGGLWSASQPDFIIYSGDIAYFLMIALIYFLIVILIMNFFVGQYQRALDHSRLYSRRLQKEIAEHKRARAKVKSSLREKDILLKEVHHRVKNNLQVISSLINLQSQTVSDLELKNRMTELRNRIRSMGLVHNQLYRSNDFSRIDFLEYAEDLIDNLIISHNNPSINVKLDVNSFRFDLNTAVPLGLIINELVTNSFKHAFPAGEKGYIQVNLEKNGKYFLLTIKDNGAGFEPDAVMNKSTSMGLDLIKTLIRQIRGRLDVESNPAQGTVFQVIFPESASI